MHKPLLIQPPAPNRWPALRELWSHAGPLWLEDLEQRLGGIAQARDVFSVIYNGSDPLATACIRAVGDIGVLGDVFTRLSYRGRGYAQAVIEAALSWFDMTGGKWLYCGCHAELAPLFEKHGFKPVHRLSREPIDDVMLQRRGTGVGITPLPLGEGEVQIRGLSRADWPLMVALLQDVAGPDPRVNRQESATTAELAMLELLKQQADGQCELLAAERANRVVALASLATVQPGERSYAMQIPHDETPPELRAAVVKSAEEKNYAQVDFPMETLA
jgi:GNAT superfamily N-acetyltransferase